MKKNTVKRNQLAMKGGSYSLVMTAVVLAILIVANIFVSAMPTTLTKYDISSSKLYSITSNTKVVVNNLQQDVTIYWLVQADEEDEIIENLLGKYESLSSHIDVVKKNPDVFPTFTEQYTDEEVPNNSIIVESGDRYRYISNNDIYETEMDYYSYTYNVTGFDGEGAITSAIDYVVTEHLRPGLLACLLRPRRANLHSLRVLGRKWTPAWLLLRFACARRLDYRRIGDIFR